MHKEIERKWLIDIDDLPFSLERAQCHHIVQSYLSFSPQVRLRAIDDAQFVITIKGKSSDTDSPLVREEREFALSKEVFRELRANAEGRTLEKMRYVVPEDGRAFEIDVFEGEYAGLAIAEMEFSSLEEAEAYPTPSWVRADVSTDLMFRNVAMAQSADPAFVLEHASTLCSAEEKAD